MLMQYSVNFCTVQVQHTRYYFTVTLFIIVVILQHEGYFDKVLGRGSATIIKLIINIIKVLEKRLIDVGGE